MDEPGFRRYHKALSLRVSQVLGAIGGTQRLRYLSMETSLTTEIINTLSLYQDGQKTVNYIFGSFCEGTTTAGMKGDIDNVFCKEDLELFQDISELPTNRDSLLLVSDADTKPGYTKLQFCSNGMPLTTSSGKTIEGKNLKADSKNRLVLCKTVPQVVDKDVYERHGPAISFPSLPGLSAIDYVRAYRCKTWPKTALCWFNRERRYNWPNDDCIKHMKSLWFFVVGIGHPHSQEEDMEWRISLSHQEKLLMFELNSTQFKCYLLMKMIKNHVLFPLIGLESISSYHCKTCLFYEIENTPGELWRPENLLACLYGCLNRMYKWSVDANCPNYFIPEENMFDRRMNHGLLVKLQDVLHRLLDADFKYVLQIRNDMFGTLLEHISLQKPPSLLKALRSAAGRSTIFLYSFAVLAATQRRNGFLRSCYSSNIDSCVKSLFRTVSKLRKQKTVTCHSERSTKKAISLILPYLELSLMSNLVTHSKDERITRSYLLSNKWKEIALSSDRFSAYLKQATFMYMLGYHEASLKVLNAVEETNDVRTRSMCFCDPARQGKGKCELAYMIYQDNVSQEDFLRNFWAPCVVFLPTEKSLTPQALQYEMLRSSSMPANSRTEPIEFWYDWAIVDGKFLLYFLLYLNHSQLAVGSKTSVYIEKMKRLLITDKFLHHKETDLNLLGWALMQENMVAEAFLCFSWSLRVKKQHNAAILHLKMKTIAECEGMALETEETKQECESEDDAVTLLYSRT